MDNYTSTNYPVESDITCDIGYIYTVIVQDWQQITGVTLELTYRSDYNL